MPEQPQKLNIRERTLSEHVMRGVKYVWENFGKPHQETPEEHKDLEELNALTNDPEQRRINTEFANFVPTETPKKLTWLEALGGFNIRNRMDQLFTSIENPEVFRETIERYETCSYEERFFDTKPVLWITFLGLGDGADTHMPQHPVSKMVPEEGIQINFSGPTGIAGFTPEQCIRSTNVIKEQVDDIVKRYPNYKIRVFGYSAGTHSANYIANALGKERGTPIDKLVLVSTGESIGYGIFSTPVTEKIAETIKNSGIDKYEYTDRIRHLTQKANTDFLPKGEDTIVIGGDNDRYIPYNSEGGTRDQIENMMRENPGMKTILAEGRDHASIVIYLAMRLKRGDDVYGIQNSTSPLRYPELPNYLKEKLIVAHDSSDTTSHPDKHPEMAHRMLARAMARIASSKNATLDVFLRAQRMWNSRNLTDSEGNVLINNPTDGLQLSRTSIAPKAEHVRDIMNFIRTYAPGRSRTAKAA